MPVEKAVFCNNSVIILLSFITWETGLWAAGCFSLEDFTKNQISKSRTRS